MEQSWIEKFKWWLCEKIGHPLPRHGWIFNGQYHRDCRWCGRIVSEPCNETNNNKASVKNETRY